MLKAATFKDVFETVEARRARYAIDRTLLARGAVKGARGAVASKCADELKTDASEGDIRVAPDERALSSVEDGRLETLRSLRAVRRRIEAGKARASFKSRRGKS